MREAGSKPSMRINGRSRVLLPQPDPCSDKWLTTLEAKPRPADRYVRLADEARATVAVCLRWGSYFAVLATRVQRAWSVEMLERGLRLAGTHGVRVIANTMTLLSWRNGPVEKVHAGQRFDHGFNERRVLPRDEKAIIRHAIGSFDPDGRPSRSGFPVVHRAARHTAALGLGKARSMACRLHCIEESSSIGPLSMFDGGHEMLTRLFGLSSHHATTYPRLAIGSAVVALVVSLGTVAGMKLLGAEINAAVPAALGAIGAASYAVPTARR